MKQKTKTWLRQGFSLASLVLMILAARSSLADHYVVPSGSMLPTVQIGDHILVNKLAYRLRVPFTRLDITRFEGPRRGDVAVFESPEDGEILLKRVAGLPGDTIEVRAGLLWQNGEPVQTIADAHGATEILDSQQHRISLALGGGPDFGPVVIPPDSYLMLGDNRGNSRDGRFFGLVPRDQILGRALGVFMRHGRLEWKPLSQ